MLSRITFLNVFELKEMEPFKDGIWDYIKKR